MTRTCEELKQDAQKARRVDKAAPSCVAPDSRECEHQPFVAPWCIRSRVFRVLRVAVRCIWFAWLLLKGVVLVGRTRRQLNAAEVTRSIRRELDRNRNGELRSSKDHVPRIMRLEIDGRDCFTRCYPALSPRELPYFGRYLIATRVLSAQGIPVPELFSAQLAMLDRRPYLLIVEEAIGGSDGRDGVRITPEFSADLARSLAKWHALDYRSMRTPVLDTHFWKSRFVTKCRDSLEYVNRIPPDLYARVAPMLGRVAAMLERPEFLGDTVVSHGDFHRRNIVIGSDRVYWIDLEDVERDPRHVDLCCAVLGIVYHSERCVDSFEREYFAAYPERERSWREHRLQTIRVVPIWKACHIFRPPRRPRKGIADVRMSQDRLKKAYRQFSIAQAAFNIEDRGQSTYELVQEIHRSARSIRRKWMDESSLGE